MGETLYQIMYQNRLETLFEQTTLEDASDVTYTRDQVLEMFGLIGKGHFTDNFMYEISGASYSNTSKIAVVSVPELFNQINKQLANTKEAYVEIHESFDGLDLNKHLLKPRGIMYRPSKQCFVKFKAPKPKPKQVSKSLMYDLRSYTVGSIQKIIVKQYGVELKQPTPSILNQTNIVRLAIKLGVTYKSFLNYTKFGIWYQDEKYSKTVLQYIEENADPDVVEATKQEYLKWWTECSNKKFPVE